MISRAAGLLVVDRPRRAVRVPSGLARRIMLVGALAAAGVLAGVFASPGHSPSSAALSSGAHGLSSLPLAAQAAVSRGLGADQSGFFVRRAPSGAVSLDNASQGLRATLSAGSIALTGAHGLRFGLSALAVGRDGALVPASGLTVASVDRNRVVYSSADVSEWFANGPLGIEQGFTLEHRAAGGGALTISQAVSGNTLARLTGGGDGVTFSSPSATLGYEHLVVTDAVGTRVPATLALGGGRLTITIEDQHAAYPLRIDPTIQQTALLTASNGAVSDELGTSVAISGSTIVAGAPLRTVGSNADQGLAYVFTQPASGGWADATQTAELTASDAAASDEFGITVAISGSTIVVGTPFHNNYRGVAYVYTEPAGGWAGNPMTQTAELSASNGGANHEFGNSVAVSGATVVVGAPDQNVGPNTSAGALYEYTEPTGGWVGTTSNPMTQTAELSASDGAGGDNLGTAVAISGSTIVAGTPSHNGTGSAYEYTKPAGGWSGSTVNPMTQTAELAPSDGAFNDVFGSAVAVSGSTIAVGAWGHNNGQGAVYVYSEPSAGWSGSVANPMAQNAELTASDGVAGGFIFNGDNLGVSVAVSLSGSTIVAGAPYHAVGSNSEQGAAYMFTEPAGGWTDETEADELTASDGLAGDHLGEAVGTSGSAIVAATPGRTVNANASQGAAYTFGDPVTASTVTLTLGPWTLNGNGTWTATATFTVEDAGGDPVSGDRVTITSSGSQVIGPVTPGSAPGTYQATITSPTNPGTATITASDTSVTPNAARTRPLGPTPTAPSPTAPSETTPSPTTPAVTPTTPGVGSELPSNLFRVSRYTRNSNGTITLTIEVPGPGSVILLGTHSDPRRALATVSAEQQPGYDRFAWARHQLRATKAGTIRVTLAPNTAGTRMLRYVRAKGWALHIRVWVTYTPTGGHSSDHVRTILVVAPRAS